VRLTDEELAALGGDAGIVALPFYDELADDERVLARQCGARSLIVRRLVRLRGDDAVLTSALARLLELRDGAEAVVCARRTTEPSPAPSGGLRATADAQGVGEGHDRSRTELRYWHRSARGVLAEAVDEDGMHRLSREPVPGLPERVADWLTVPPPVGGSGHGPPTASVVAAAVRCADVVVRRAGDTGSEGVVLLSVLSGPTGAALVRSATAVAGAATPPADVRPTSRDEVAAQIRGLLPASGATMDG
jgi:hypothetical protein